MPFTKLVEWLKKEKELGIEQPECVVLSTVTTDGLPHCRVVAVREIETDSLLFFTQRSTRKVTELLNNPSAAMNFFLAMQQRQIILEGVVKPLSQEENKQFWQTLPRERQLRFSSYAATSGQIIQDLNQLENRRQELSVQFTNKLVPMSEFYCGFRFTPATFIFYTVGSISFSEVIKYSKEASSWRKELLSP